MSPTTLLNYKMAKEKGEREREKKDLVGTPKLQ
jgi:hypothetical protein